MKAYEDAQKNQLSLTKAQQLLSKSKLSNPETECDSQKLSQMAIFSYKKHSCCKFINLWEYKFFDRRDELSVVTRVHQSPSFGSLVDFDSFWTKRQQLQANVTFACKVDLVLLSFSRKFRQYPTNSSYILGGFIQASSKKQSNRLEKEWFLVIKLLSLIKLCLSVGFSAWYRNQAK